jgi:transcriptional regulator GlxA family with amidase domain
MAEIGILRSGKGTVHWKSLAAFAERYYDLEIVYALFVSNGAVTSCAGELATLDMVIDIISTISPAAAEATANHLLISFPRDGYLNQPGSQMAHQRHMPDVVAKAVKAMVANIEDPLQAEEIARYCDVSVRQLERLFQRALQTPPMRYYTKIRLEKAYDLIYQTNASLIDIALASGFSSVNLMSRKFRGYYNKTPAQCREKSRMLQCASAE